MRKAGAPFLLFSLLLALGVAASAASAAPGAEAARRPVSAADLVAFKSVTGIVASPDGKAAVVSLRGANVDENRYETDLWLVPLDGRPPRQLTFHTAPETSSAWSPDGTRIAFIARRGEATEVHVLPLSGGEASAYATVRAIPSSLAWAPDGHRLAITGPPEEGEPEIKRRRERDDAVEIGAQWRNHRVWIASEGTLARAVTDGKRHVALARWSPDGKQLALLTRPTPEADSTEDSRLELLELESGRTREVPDSAQASDVKWSPDGGMLLIVRPYDGRGISRGDAFVWPIGSPRAVNLTRALDRDVEQVFWRERGRVEVLYSSGAVSALSTIDVQTTSIVDTWAPGIALSEIEPAGTSWLFVGGDQPDELQIKEAAGVRTLTSWNASPAGAMQLPVSEVVRWRGPTGPLEGVLVRPAEPEAGRRYPLLVVPHGGPRAHSPAAFDVHAAFFVAQGYLVFKPNFRGSTGYGDLFSRANVANWGEGPHRDVLSGVESLVVRGIVDPARLFIYGWSYGGYLVNWAVTHGNQFRAAASGAGVADLRLQYAISDARRWRFDYFTGTPFTGVNMPAYERDSPVTYARQAKTPTLFLHGHEDQRCPLSQGLMMYRALQDNGVEARLVVYPREGHGFIEPRHIIDRAQRIADWFHAHDVGQSPSRRPSTP